uniref:Parvin, alpha a n=1 Tax=Hippocampus comes TaxID=109280 RepID=A0A3Q2YY18_HIPCM
ISASGARSHTYHESSNERRHLEQGISQGLRRRCLWRKKGSKMEPTLTGSDGWSQCCSLAIARPCGSHLVHLLEENEVRTMVDPNSKNDRKLQELMKVLIDWINDVLVGERIIVKDLAEDLYDGQVLQKLFEKLEGEKLNVAEVTQSEIAQKQKLQTVLERINDSLKLSTRNIRWNVDFNRQKYCTV